MHRVRKKINRLLASNGLDAASRGIVDYTIDIIAVLLLSASALQMGLLNFLGAAPFLILGIPIGVFVERADPKITLIINSIIKSVMLFLLFAILASGSVTFTFLAIGYFFIGICTVVAETSQASYAVSLSENDVGRTFSALQAADSAVGLVIPAVCGILISIVEAPALIVAAAVCSTMAAVVLRLKRDKDLVPSNSSPARSLHPPSNSTSTQKALRRFFQEATHGASYVIKNPLMLRLSLASVFTSLGLAAFSAVEVILILRDLSVSPTEFGFVLSSAAVGGLVGSLISQPIARRIQRVRLVKISYMLLVPAAASLYLLLIPNSPVLYILMFQAIFWGIVMVANNIQVAALVAEHSPQGMIARITSVRRTLSMGAIPLGAFIGGALGTFTGPWGPLALWTILVLLAAVIVGTLPRTSQKRASENVVEEIPEP